MTLPANKPSAEASEAGGIFQEIGGRGSAFGGRGHLGGYLTGSSDAVRCEDGAQILEQRFLRRLKEGPPKSLVQGEFLLRRRCDL